MDLTNLLMIAAIFGAFWFLIIRPQQQRQRKQADMISALSAGEEIVTIGGIYATVVEVGERIRVRVADGSELEIAPQAVGRVLPAEVRTDEAPSQATAEEELEEPTDDGEGLGV